MHRAHIIGLFALAIFAQAGHAGSSPPVDISEVPQDDAVSQGGRLYDKWWAELGLAEPQSTHPAYPPAAGKRGGDTWRCKECHGWDYRGREGAYRKGSHFTGITGVRGYAGGDAEAVLRRLVDETHGYQQVLPPQALQLLATFVVQGQIGMERYIDEDSGEVKAADLRRGRALYNRSCARCHDEDGRYMNFNNSPSSPEYVGTLARSNPWETWHKIRNGHPGARMPMGPAMRGRWRHNESMPPFRSWSVEDQLAVLAYTRTLPPE